MDVEAETLGAVEVGDAVGTVLAVAETVVVVVVVDGEVVGAVEEPVGEVLAL